MGGGWAEECESAQHDRALDEPASGALRGHLTLGLVAGATILRIPALLGAFRLAHPDIALTLRQDPSESMLTAVGEGTLDMAVVGIPDAAVFPGIGIHYLHTEPLVVAVAPGHRWSTRRTLRLAELNGVALLTLTSGAGLRPLVQRACRQAGFEPVFACESNDLDLLIEVAAARLGVAILPISAVSAAHHVVAVPLTAPTLHRQLALAWRAAELQARSLAGSSPSPPTG